MIPASGAAVIFPQGGVTAAQGGPRGRDVAGGPFVWQGYANGPK